MACTDSDIQKMRDVGVGLMNNEIRVWDEGRGIALLGYHPEERSMGIFRYSVYSLV